VFGKTEGVERGKKLRTSQGSDDPAKQGKEVSIVGREDGKESKVKTRQRRKLNKKGGREKKRGMG